MLTVQNYTLGNSLTGCNLISFTYTSSLLNYSVTQTGSSSLSGTLPNPLPGMATVTVSSPSAPTFNSNLGGAWTVGYSDDGTSSIWQYPPPTVPTLKPAVWGALGLLLAGAGALLARSRWTARA
jgi:hypothetical protein